MTAAGRVPAAAWIPGLVLLACVATPPVWAQAVPSQFDLSGSIYVDEVDSAVRAHLERVKAYSADQQWDEAIETLRQVMQTASNKVIALTDRVYVNVPDYCQVQIASLPPEALTLYRQRVDPVAQQWYEEAMGRRDVGRLADVVREMFCSSWGDDALLALGELALEQGDYRGARSALEKLIEYPPQAVPVKDFEAARQQENLPAEDAARIERWYARDDSHDPPMYRLRSDAPLSDGEAAALVRFWKQRRLPLTRLAYPETTIDLAEIRAQLVLVSILEGSLDRARAELRVFERLHPSAEGRLGGQRVRYAAELASLIAAAGNWRPLPATEDWTTFAGSPERTKIAASHIDLGRSVWPAIALGDTLTADFANARNYSSRRIAEDTQALLSCHPLVVDGLLLFNNQSQIFAFDLHKGTPAWPGDSKRPPGEIFSTSTLGVTSSSYFRGLGVPRFTMTAHEGKLYACLGSQVTSWPIESTETRAGYLVSLDLTAQGRERWRAPLDDEKTLLDPDKWAFEGAPVVDGNSVYVAMRKSDVRPQSHVACFDADTGHLRWRTMICSAETPAGGQTEEITHNLLTLEHGTLYCNTNLGAVAAISGANGRIQWISLYPRVKRAGFGGQEKRLAHFYRDLNPCVYYRGVLIVAPSDCEHIFSLDAGTGEMIWETQLAEDAVHLLGVGHGNLIATGDRVWWIDALGGKVLYRWPDATPRGYGRGVLTGDEILWPTRESLYVLRQRPPGPGQSILAQPTIALADGRGAMGGNLLLSDGVLVVATANKLFAFQQRGAKSTSPAAAVDADTARHPTATDSLIAGRLQTGSSHATRREQTGRADAPHVGSTTSDPPAVAQGLPRHIFSTRDP